MSRWAWLFGAAFLAATLAATACGGDEKEIADSQTPAAAASPSPAAVSVEADDFYFDPEEIAATAGAPVEVTVFSEGTLTHTFTIDELSVDISLAPWESKVITVTPSATGAFRIYCRFHGDSEGMQGTLTVTGS